MTKLINQFRLPFVFLASSAEAVDKGRERRRPSRERLQRSSSGRGPTSLNQGSGNATGAWPK